jgi:catechol-2,3-dioxygenase
LPAIAELGHVGIFVNDLEISRRFYTEMLGLTVTDEDDRIGVVFLSSRPDFEHHEVALVRGRNAGAQAKVVQQISFRCDTLEDVLSFYQRLVAHEVPINMTITHGNAIGVYFADPDGNNCELYWQTRIPARQPFLQKLDFTKSPDELVQEVRRRVAESGDSGRRDRAAVQATHSR